MQYTTQNFIVDATQQNHLLIAGTTGSGKSTLLKAILYHLTLTGIRFDIIDLKQVSLIEFEPLTRIGYTYAETPETVLKVLDNGVKIMDQRYKRMKQQLIDKSTEPPYYIIIDEAADLFDLMPEVKPIIKHLLRLGRAANIRLIFASQSPDRKTIPAAIQQNITSVIALRCKSTLESRQIMGVKGAETLRGVGYGYYYTARMDHPELIKINELPRKELQNAVNFQLLNARR